MVWAFGIALSVGVSVATAQQAPPPTPDKAAATKNEAPAPATLPEDTEILDADEELKSMKRSALRKYAPRHYKLPPIHDQQIDYTAYTLEMGETELGLLHVRVGVFDSVQPSVQVGTAPLLNLSGMFNGQLKVKAFEIGPVALSADFAHYNHTGGLDIRHTNTKLNTSVVLFEDWSVHGSVGYLGMYLNGFPQPDSWLPTLVSTLGGVDLSAWQELASQGATINADIDAVTLGVATDYRLNRRDSVIVQLQTAMWSQAESGRQGGLDIPDDTTVDDLLSLREQGWNAPYQMYSVSAAWQFNWKRTHLRVGLGLSSIESYWLTQATEFGIRFGGANRRRERRIQDTYQQNRKEPRLDFKRGMGLTKEDLQASEEKKDSETLQ